MQSETNLNALAFQTFMQNKMCLVILVLNN